jgi:ribosomal protein S4
MKLAKAQKSETLPFFFKCLDNRLDSVVFRTGVAPTIRAARQLVTHGHVKVNQSTLTIPSYPCQDTDAIDVKNVLTHSRAASETKQSFLSFTMAELATSQRTYQPKVNKAHLLEFYHRKI